MAKAIHSRTYHFLFLDVVGFSAPGLSAREQAKIVSFLNRVVTNYTTIKRSDQNQVVMRSTGDGMVIGFHDSKEKPYKLAIEIQKRILAMNKKKTLHKFKVRIGLHSGDIYPTKDITGHDDVTLIISSLAFYFMWAASVLLLRHYSRTVGKSNIGFMLALPAIPYLLAFVVINLQYYADPNERTTATFLSLVNIPIVGSNIVSGILFSFPFLLICRKLTGHALIVRKYLLIASLGIILFYISQNAYIQFWIFPPTGFAAVSIQVLSAYLMFIGLHLSLVAISGDASLRAAIRNYLKEDPKMFEELAIAEVGHQLHNQVEDILVETRQYEKLDSSLGRPTADQINEYIKEVVNEIRSSRKE